MNIFKKISWIEFDPNQTQILGIKSGIVWGYLEDSNECSPLRYISKPKNISEEDFYLLLDRIDVQIIKQQE